MPVLAYSSDPGDEFEEEFLHLTSTTREEIQLETCTPVMEKMLNVMKTFAVAKHRLFSTPEKW